MELRPIDMKSYAAAPEASMSPRDVEVGVRRGGRWHERERSAMNRPVCSVERLFHRVLRKFSIAD